MGRLKDYCEKQGVYFTREMTEDLLETFKVDGLPELADTSKSTAVAKLHCFLRDAFRRGWITESLVDRVTAHRAVYTQKEPYSDEEVEKILAEALKLNGGTHGYAKHPKTFRLLLELRSGDSWRTTASGTSTSRTMTSSGRVGAGARGHSRWPGLCRSGSSA